jgi:hypothetical protein
MEPSRLSAFFHSSCWMSAAFARYSFESRSVAREADVVAGVRGALEEEAMEELEVAGWRK